MQDDHSPLTWKVVVAGLLGGVAGALATTRFESRVDKTIGGPRNREPDRFARQGGKQLYDMVAELHSRPAADPRPPAATTTTNREKS